MFEVTTYTAGGEEIDTAEADDMKAARVAASTLWKDSVEHETGVARAKIYREGVAVSVFTHCPA